jgi:murein tripeptide amidase MpaA
MALLWTHEALVIDPGLKQSSSFSWNFENEKEVRFSVNIPYFQRDWEKFLERFKSSKYLNVSVLTESTKKRNVELVHITCSNQKPRYRVILTSRHHACESMGTWVMEGFLKQVLRDNETGEWFRRNVEIVAVPFMDKDGVEDGIKVKTEGHMIITVIIA